VVGIIQKFSEYNINMVINTVFTYSLDKNKEYWKYVATTIAQMLSKVSLDNNIYIYIY
jgi:hypothetical protein